MDLTENENFSQSIFFDKTEVRRFGKYKWNHWWYKRDSDDIIKLIFGYRPDAWHIAKSIMIILVIISAVISIYFEGPLFNLFNNKWLNAILDITTRGILWNVIFPLFYHKLFRKKTWQK